MEQFVYTISLKGFILIDPVCRAIFRCLCIKALRVAAHEHCGVAVNQPLSVVQPAIVSVVIIAAIHVHGAFHVNRVFQRYRHRNNFTGQMMYNNIRRSGVFHGHSLADHRNRIINLIAHLNGHADVDTGILRGFVIYNNRLSCSGPFGVLHKRR